MAIGWGVPAIVVGGLLIFDRINIVPTKKRNPNFQYGHAQAAISLFVLVIAFIGKQDSFGFSRSKLQFDLCIHMCKIYSDHWMLGATPEI